MKDKGLISRKIENILMKRYALEKIIPFGKFFLVFSLSIISFILFFLYWIFMSLYKDKGDVNEFIVSAANIIVLISILSICYIIWSIIGKFIPKFVLIGLLGWFFIGAGLLSDILEPGSIITADPNAESIQIPAGRFTGLNEKDSDRIAEFKPGEFSLKSLGNLLDIFLAPTIYKAQKDSSELKETQKSVAICLSGGCPLFILRVGELLYKKTIEEKNNSPAIFRMAEFKSIRFMVFFFFILISLDLFLTVTMFKKPGVSYNFYYFHLFWRKRDRCVRVKAVLFAIFGIILFFLTMNYFFILLVLLVLINIFLIKWEIQQRGQNHKLYTRAVLFLFLIHFFSLTAGQVFFLIYLPVFIFIREGIQILSLYDAVLINWIVLVGSLASILIGLTTQVVWSGKRLTEKLESKEG